MRLGKVYQKLLPNGRVRLYGEALYESTHNSNLNDIFYFEYPSNVQSSLVDSGDPWLVLFLPISVVLGESLHITKQVDPLLLEGCLEVLAIWNCWKPHFPIINIEVECQSNSAFNTNKTGAFFSGGVDSMHTLLRHEDSPSAPRSEHIDELITIIDIFGNEKEIIEERKRKALYTRLDVLAQKYNKKMIDVHTNIWQTRFQLTNSLDHSIGCLLAATSLAIGKRYSRVLIPSSQTYKEGLEGSHALTDKLLSTTTTRIITDACDFTRYQKISYLAKNNHNLSYLHVCSRDKDFNNCSKCFKCIRSMLVLEVLEKLDECRLFKYPKLDLQKIERIYCSTSHLLYDLQMVHSEAKIRAKHDIVQVINTIFSRSAWLDSCRRLIQKLRKFEQPTPNETKIISEILGLIINPNCSEETRTLLDSTLEEYEVLKNHLCRLIQNTNSKKPIQSVIKDDYFLLLEHALLLTSYCASTLDLQLRGSQTELCKPEVIYIQEAPYVVLL